MRRTACVSWTHRPFPLVFKKRNVFMENVMEARYKRLRGLEDEEIIRQSRRGCGARGGACGYAITKTHKILKLRVYLQNANMVGM